MTHREKVPNNEISQRQKKTGSLSQRLETETSFKDQKLFSTADSVETKEML